MTNEASASNREVKEMELPNSAAPSSLFKNRLRSGFLSIHKKYIIVYEAESNFFYSKIQ